MGFFNILETFFFISLAITFVLIMMLVYHFKGRICVLEQKCDTMFEIMNNIVKELRTIKMSSTNCVNPAMIVPNNETIMFQQRHNLGELFQQFQQDQFNYDDDDEDEYDDEDDDVNNNKVKKIIVSDTEYEDEDEDQEHEKQVKIINIEFNEDESNVSNESIDNLEALEEEHISLEDDEVEAEAEAEAEAEDVSAIDTTVDDSLEQSIDYKKMDISYLRTMVITRGLATDTKKMKKSDLIKLLEDSKE
jgi:hypothetical protein